jgi:hypothetical protein
VSDDPKLGEKQRTCPSCRCTISVLASKCRFCGEVVGKPKEEARQLSINDLGGENVQHRALSNSVMDALEAFRIEDAKDEPLSGGVSGIDDFDMDGSASSGPKDYNQSPLSAPTGAVRASSGGINFSTIAKIAAVVVVVAIVAIKAPAYLKSTLDNDAVATVPTFRNDAPDILESTGNPIKALEAAIAASRENPNDENSKIIDEMAAEVLIDIKSLLDASPWDKTKLKEASTKVTTAAQLYPQGAVKEAQNLVKAENAAYSLTLMKIDSVTEKAEFKTGASGGKVVFAGRGETVGDRFRVVSISGSGSVKLEDTQRGNRRLELEVAQSLRR